MRYYNFKEEELRNEVLQYLNTRDNFKAYCIFHEDGRNPNMILYPTSVHCFSCGAHYSYSEVLARLISKREGIDLNSAFDEILTKYGDKIDQEYLDDRVKRILKDPTYDNRLLYISTKARLDRTSANFDEVERSLFFFDFDP